MAASVLLTVRKYLHARLSERKKFVMLTAFMLIPLPGSLLQIFFTASRPSGSG